MLTHRQEPCVLCGGCAAVCPEDAIEVFHGHIELALDRCTSCGKCVAICPSGALALN